MYEFAVCREDSIGHCRKEFHMIDNPGLPPAIHYVVDREQAAEAEPIEDPSPNSQPGDEAAVGSLTVTVSAGIGEDAVDRGPIDPPEPRSGSGGGATRVHPVAETSAVIGPLTISGAEGVLSFTAKLEPLTRWANDPLDRWGAAAVDSAASRMLDPLDRWDGELASDAAERRLDPLERWSAR
ncbi:hypothetical protein [Nocardia brasiliensis]|uniref:hypothetical protein n=1 Tax=Nocardia brasiliensis TaxID=37326 RepID=UPI001894DF38|nr:hypothetical protein [Nocardia brasiliensis]MBF6129869.1 hypothetical protein [Nocardia brasiliensis]